MIKIMKDRFQIPLYFVGKFIKKCFEKDVLLL